MIPEMRQEVLLILSFVCHARAFWLQTARALLSAAKNYDVLVTLDGFVLVHDENNEFVLVHDENNDFVLVF